jgi:hypothetical protein
MGTSLMSLPLVQDAVTYALNQLADWQNVPTRVLVAQNAIRALGPQLASQNDVAGVAALTADQQALQGVQQQYADSTPLVGEMIQAAALVNRGGSPDPATVADAARLAGVMASGLATLAQVEQDVQSRGGTLAVGPGGGLAIPTWGKWAAIGLGLLWFLKSLARRRRTT